MSSEFFLRIEEIEAILKNFDEKKFSKDRKFRNAMRNQTIKDLEKFKPRELAMAMVHYLIAKGICRADCIGGDGKSCIKWRTCQDRQIRAEML